MTKRVFNDCTVNETERSKVKDQTMIVLLNPVNGGVPKGFIAKLIIERHGIAKILKANGEWLVLPSSEILFIASSFVPKR